MQPRRPSRMGEWMRRTGVKLEPLTRRLAGRRLAPLFAVVHHRGRRSGRSHTATVAIRRTPDGFVIPLPYAGAQWPRNVLAAGECSIRWGGADHRAVEPRIVGWDEAAQHFHPLQRAIVRLLGIDTFLHLRRLRPQERESRRRASSTRTACSHAAQSHTRRLLDVLASGGALTLGGRALRTHSLAASTRPALR